jgi:hypothetical protein
MASVDSGSIITARRKDNYGAAACRCASEADNGGGLCKFEVSACIDE